jgi:hypothetical protein
MLLHNRYNAINDIHLVDDDGVPSGDDHNSLTTEAGGHNGAIDSA